MKANFNSDLSWEKTSVWNLENGWKAFVSGFLALQQRSVVDSD